MSDWRKMARWCVHCGADLEARPVHHSIVIDGFEPMEYRHALTGKKECWQRNDARPYTNCGAHDEWAAIGSEEEMDEQ